MATPKRLLDAEDLSPEARALLEAVPPTPSMPPDVGAGLSARMRTLGESPAPAGGSLSVVKGSLAVLAVAAVAFALWPGPTPSTDLPAPPTRKEPAPARQVRYTSPAEKGGPASSPGRPTTAPRTSSGRVGAATPPSTAPAPSGGLAEELRILDAARRQLLTRPEAALDLTRTHARRFPDGQLADLRDFIQIQVYDRQGNVTEVRARAERFFVKHPQSTLGKEVRGILADHGH